MKKPRGDPRGFGSSEASGPVHRSRSGHSYLKTRFAPLVEMLMLLQTNRGAIDDAHELAEALAFRKAMENSLVTGLRARDLEGRITYVNPAFCEMVGLPAESLLGLNSPPPYWPPEMVTEYGRRQALRLAGNAPPREGWQEVLGNSSALAGYPRRADTLAHAASPEAEIRFHPHAVTGTNWLSRHGDKRPRKHRLSAVLVSNSQCITRKNETIQWKLRLRDEVKVGSCTFSGPLRHITVHCPPETLPTDGS